jgi:molecular chaperone GrpE (heat shock protein)
MCLFNRKKEIEKAELKQELNELKAQMEELKGKLLELKADFENKSKKYDDHLKNDKDLEEGNDEVVWEEYN